MNASYLRQLRASGALKAICSDRMNNRQCKRIVIDYSSPNIGKQFHIGNLRSTLIGRYVDKVHRAIGNQVFSVNYLGDWGTQFAMIAAYWPKVRPSDSFWNSCSDVDKIRAITDCYVVANKKRKEDESFREEVRQTFAEMENEILTWQYESTCVRDARCLVSDLVKDKIARRTSAGLWVVDLHHGDLEEYAIIRKSDDTTIYLSRDLASILSRDNLLHADRYLYIVDHAQRKHFEALRMALNRMGRGDLAEKIQHVPYGRVKGLSTRIGRTEIVEEIIGRGKELALQFMKESKTFKLPPEKEDKVAWQLSLSTVIFNDLKRAKSAEYEFSFKNAFDLNRNNALLLQASLGAFSSSSATGFMSKVRHSRLCSIEENNLELLPLLDECDAIPEETPDFARLAVHLSQFPEVIFSTAETIEPCHLVVYLIELSHKIGTVTPQAKIKGQPVDIAVPRLLLLSASRAVLREGMSLLGATPVVTM